MADVAVGLRCREKIRGAVCRCVGALPLLPGKDKVLVARLEDGKLYCAGSSCSHYSAPLAKGKFSRRLTRVYACLSRDVNRGVYTPAVSFASDREAVPKSGGAETN